MSNLDGRLMECEQRSGRGPGWPGGTAKGDRGPVEAIGTRYRAVLWVAEGFLDGLTRDGDGGDGLARARLQGRMGRFVQANGANSE